MDLGENLGASAVVVVSENRNIYCALYIILIVPVCHHDSFNQFWYAVYDQTLFMWYIPKAQQADYNLTNEKLFLNQQIKLSLYIK